MVMLALSILIIAFASFLWLKYLDTLDLYKKDKGTTRITIIAFVAGMISIIPTFGLYAINPYNAISAELGIFLYYFFIVGMSEELSKYLLLVVVVVAFKSIKEPQDGIIQGAAVGLGFSAVENFTYALEFGPITTVLRSISASGGHMIYGALAGFFLGGAVYANLEVEDKRAKELAFLSVFLVAVLHALYNSALRWTSSNERLEGMAIAIDLVGLILAIAAFRYMVSHSPYRVFPYSRSRDAVAAVERGLRLNPTSYVLNRRLILYKLADRDFRGALEPIRVCRKRVKRQGVLDALEGVAMFGMGRDDKGFALLTKAHTRLDSKMRLRVSQVLRAALGDGALRMRADNILNPHVFVPNPHLRREQPAAKGRRSRRRRDAYLKHGSAPGVVGI